MKALVLEAPRKFEYTDVPTPTPGPGDVLIRVRAVGICGSDVHGMDGSSGRRIPPIIMGHEAAGEVVEVGAAESGWRLGERVTFDSTVYCGTCDYCRAGQINLCDNRRVLGVSCKDYRQHGAFAEYVVVPQHILHRLPDNVSFSEGAMVEPLSIALHAVSLTPIQKSEAAVVIGAGTIGLLTIQVLRSKGVRQIFAIDLDPGRLKLARVLGATTTIQPDKVDAKEAVDSATGGKGVGVVFEAVGIASTVTLATNLLQKGGALTLIGNLAPRTDLLLQAVVTRELRLQGSCASNGEYPECINAIASGAINLTPLMSAIAPLSKGAMYFERLYTGGGGLLKVILEP